MERSETLLPHFNTTNDLVEFFDAHDMGDYADQLPEAHFEVRGRSDRLDRPSIEENIRQMLAQEYHTPLSKKRLAVGTRANGEPRLHEFDGVSPDQNIVFEVKSNQVKPTKSRPAGRYFSAIKWALLGDIYMLSRVAAKTKLLVLTDRALYDICRQDTDGILPENVQIIYRNPLAQAEGE